MPKRLQTGIPFVNVIRVASKLEWLSIAKSGKTVVSTFDWARNRHYHVHVCAQTDIKKRLFKLLSTQKINFIELFKSIQWANSIRQI
jgi:hypothetical protein